jgi:hypothetical protein
MDLLATYSDNSDDEVPISIPSKSVPEVLKEINTSQKPSRLITGEKKAIKKRRKLDISFLPENIQAALARGDSINSDSDSDQETNKKHITTSTRNVKYPTLLAQLPQPKNIINDPLETVNVLDDDDNMNENMGGDAMRNNEDSNNYNYIDTNHFDLEENSQKSIKPSVNDFVIDNHGLHNNIDSSKSSLSVPPRPLTSSVPFTSLLLQKSEFSAAPKVSQSSIAAYQSTPSLASDSKIPSIGKSLPGNLSTSHGSLTTSTSTRHAEVISMPPTNRVTTGSKSSASSRRRDREIEQELLTGNASAVEGSNFIDVKASGSWDMNTYMDQQKRQQELHNAFFGQNAGDKMISQPTKNQSKKHQINSLAFAAAQSEFELLEAKATRMKSKHETQSKYGW